MFINFWLLNHHFWWQKHHFWWKKTSYHFCWKKHEKTDLPNPQVMAGSPCHQGLATLAPGSRDGVQAPPRGLEKVGGFHHLPMTDPWCWYINLGNL
jgi:hypothetical protein